MHRYLQGLGSRPKYCCAEAREGRAVRTSLEIHSVKGAVENCKRKIGSKKEGTLSVVAVVVP